MSFLTKINGTSGAIETAGTQLDISATSLVLPNRATGSNNAGAMYFDTASNSFQGYNGSGWVTIQSGLQNSGGTTKVEIGSSSNDIVFTNDSSESMRVIANGNVGIGTNNPQSTLDVSGDISEKGELLEDKYNFKNSSWSGRFQIDTSSNFTIDISFNNDASRILNFLFDVEYIGSSSNGGRDTYFKNRYGFNKYTSNETPVIVDSEYISTQSYEVFTEYIHDTTATNGQRGAIQINIRPPVYSVQPVIYSRVYVNIYSNSNTFEVTDTMLTNGSSNTTITDVNPLMDSSNTSGFDGPNYKIFGGSVGIGTNNPDKALSVAGEINSTGLHLNTNTQDNIQNATNTFILNGSNASINDINSSTALTLNGGATISSNGVVLDGLNDFITIPKSLLNFGSNNFTISLWAEYKGANSNGDINGNIIFNIGNYSSGTASFIIYLGINNEIKFYSTTEYIGEETSGYTYRLSDKKFEADGIIHNFVITRSSNILRLFVDGVNAFSNNMNLSGQTFDDVDYEIGYYTGGDNSRYTKMDVHRLDIWKKKGFTNVDDIYNVGYTSSLIYGSITGSIDETTKMGKLTFGTSSNGTTLTDNMTILPDGNVGIGSTQPDSRLTIGSSSKSSNQYLKIATAGSYTSGIKYLGGTANEWYTQHIDGTSQANRFAIGMDSSEFMSIINSGNVGIGTTNPQATLDVDGTMNVTGATTLGSTLDVDGSMNVTGATTLGSTLDVGGTMNVTGATTLGSTLDVDGSLNVTGATTLGSTLTVAKATTLATTLDVAGASTFGSSLIVNGNVGIGTNNPQKTLHVAGTSIIGSGVNNITPNGVPDPSIQCKDIVLHNNSANDQMFIRRIGVSEYQFQTYKNGNAGEIHLQPYGGNVGIGSTQPNSKLDVNGSFGAGTNGSNFTVDADGDTDIAGTLTVTGAADLNGVLDVAGASTFGSTLDVDGSLNVTGASTFGSTLYVTSTVTASQFNARSDKNLKENINPISNDILNDMLNLNGKTYNMISDVDKIQLFGLIAQDVEEIFPNLVDTNESNTKSINYIDLIPLLVEHIKKLTKRIDILESKET